MKDTDFLLESIAKPDDLKSLTREQRKELCSELRRNIMRTVAANGGHLSSNLGTVELTVALETVFSGSHDRIIWDVGHQSYSHKLLTGRYSTFSTLRKAGGLSGFQSPAESEYDPFYTGHAGVALSTALGMAEAYARNGDTDSTVVAVVGDGALGSGPSLEALNSIRGCHTGGFLLVINDNRMSISRSVGTLSRHLNHLITGRVYNHFKSAAKYILKHVPLGHHLIRGIRRMESAMKSLLVPGAFFEELGFKYIGPINGHDVEGLLEKLRKIREIRQIPVCLHVVTEKGHGCAFAEKSPDKYHGVSAFDLSTGKTFSPPEPGLTFSQVFGQALTDLAHKHEDVTAITAAMSSGTGLAAFEKVFPGRFYDVGIAEEHAVAFAAGLAAGGLRPVLAIYATFLQRALDQVFHDVCLQKLPVIFCVDRSGAVEDGPTHHGIYDLSFLRTLPGLSILFPSSAEILKEMLNAAYDRKEPVMIRYPKGKAPERSSGGPLVWGKSAILRTGSDMMIWACGAECETAEAVAELLLRKGIRCGIRDVRFLKPFDTEALKEDLRNKKQIVSIEDAIPSSGLGGEIDRVACLENCQHAPFLHFGWPEKCYVPHGKVPLLRESFGLTPERIAEKILEKQ